METTSYYNVDIAHLTEDDEPATYEFELCGWVYKVETLDEAKAKIKANISEHRCYWRNF
jgi:hypothetical protein